jgi:hypothetical protein
MRVQILTTSQMLDVSRRAAESFEVSLRYYRLSLDQISLANGEDPDSSLLELEVDRLHGQIHYRI